MIENPIDLCDHCHKSGAQSKCGKCREVYYCSKECQVNDWKSHKSSCLETHMIMSKYLESIRIMNDYIRDHENVDLVPCVSCGEVFELSGAIELQCSHFYCMDCLSSNLSEMSTIHCCVCNKSVPGLGFLEKVCIIILQQCEKYDLVENERAKLLFWGRIFVDKIKDLYTHHFPEKDLFCLRRGILEGKQLIMEGLYDEALRQYQSLLLPDEEFENVNEVKPQILYELGRCYQMLGYYIEAIDYYQQSNDSKGKVKFTSTEMIVSGKYDSYDATIGICRCHFQLKQYDMVVSLASSYIAAYRNSPGYHEIIAKALIELGHLDRAIIYLKHGIRYENAWEQDRNEQLAKLLRALKS